MKLILEKINGELYAYRESEKHFTAVEAGRGGQVLDPSLLDYDCELCDMPEGHFIFDLAEPEPEPEPRLQDLQWTKSPIPPDLHHERWIADTPIGTYHVEGRCLFSGGGVVIFTPRSYGVGLAEAVILYQSESTKIEEVKERANAHWLTVAAGLVEGINNYGFCE